MVKTKQALIDRKLFSDSLTHILECYNDIDSYRHYIKSQWAIQTLFQSDNVDFLKLENELSQLVYTIESKYNALIQALSYYFQSKSIGDIRKAFIQFTSAITALADSLIPHVQSEARRDLLATERSKIQNYSEEIVKHFNQIDRKPIPALNINVNYQISKLA